MTKATLEAHGYRVLTACDGTEAVALYAKHHATIQAVLTDMMMPIMDGTATIQALHQIDPQVRIIAVSGMLEHGEASDAGSAVVQATLSKPYSMERLLTTLREVLCSGSRANSRSVLGTSNGEHNRDDGLLVEACEKAVS
jgi:CheY-like chemotaxis protein